MTILYQFLKTAEVSLETLTPQNSKVEKYNLKQKLYFNIDDNFNIGTYLKESMVSKNIGVFFEFNHIISFKSLETIKN